MNLSENISDLFSCLMIIFLFISISLLLEVNEDKKRITDMASSHMQTKELIYIALTNEFANDLEKWNAEITDDLTIRFTNPEILFDGGSSEIQEEYKRILDNFFPRYISTISDFVNVIDTISIDGHTDSTGWNDCTDECSYFRNMYLSQMRSFNTLEYCASLVNDNLIIANKFVATGLSYSRPITDEDGTVIDSLSKRVEFTIRLDMQKTLDSIATL